MQQNALAYRTYWSFLQVFTGSSSSLSSTTARASSSCPSTSETSWRRPKPTTRSCSRVPDKDDQETSPRRDQHRKITPQRVELLCWVTFVSRFSWTWLEKVARLTDPTAFLSPVVGVSGCWSLYLAWISHGMPKMCEPYLIHPCDTSKVIAVAVWLIFMQTFFTALGNFNDRGTIWRINRLATRIS